MRMQQKFGYFDDGMNKIKVWIPEIKVGVMERGNEGEMLLAILRYQAYDYLSFME